MGKIMQEQLEVLIQTAYQDIKKSNARLEIESVLSVLVNEAINVYRHSELYNHESQFREFLERHK